MFGPLPSWPKIIPSPKKNSPVKKITPFNPIPINPIVRKRGINMKQLFMILFFFKARRFNAIGFRRIDGKVYGLQLGEHYTLISFDASYRVEELDVITALPSNLLFVAADITPDDRYLVVFGYSTEEPGNLLALIDLESENFTTSIIPLSSTSSLENIKCADVAFHPTTGKLYGYDHYNKVVIELDLADASISKIAATENTLVNGNVPSIFFSPNGQLMGIGSESELLSNRSFIHFDIKEGVSILKKLPFEGNQDACSCPYNFQLQNKILQPDLYSCTDNTATIYLRNFGKHEYQFDLFDTFPPGVQITGVQTGLVYDSLKIKQAHVLTIHGLQVPLGVDSIIIYFYTNEKIKPGTYANQVFLKGDSVLQFHTQTLKSDDPETLAIGDPTWVQHSEDAFDFEEHELFLCAEDTLILSTDIKANRYIWNTGDTTSFLKVCKPGTYSLTLITGCDTLESAVSVRSSLIHVDLPDTLRGVEGIQIDLVPDLESSNPIVSYFWWGNQQQLNCISCPQTSVQLSSPGHVFVTVTSEAGCTATDSSFLLIGELNIFIPNAFSPNGDGINDAFLLYSTQDYHLITLDIFDRWGNKVFNAHDESIDSSFTGWKGTTTSYKPSPPGLYIWRAIIRDQAFKQFELSGEVYLLR